MVHLAPSWRERLSAACPSASAYGPRRATMSCPQPAPNPRLFDQRMATIGRKPSSTKCTSGIRSRSRKVTVIWRGKPLTSAALDLWSDPRGEFLAAKAAEPVYQLLGAGGLDAEGMPEVDQPTGGVLRYLVRTGGHDLNRWDWLQFLAFADRHLS